MHKISGHASVRAFIALSFASSLAASRDDELPPTLAVLDVASHEGGANRAASSSGGSANNIMIDSSRDTGGFLSAQEARSAADSLAEVRDALPGAVANGADLLQFGPTPTKASVGNPSMVGSPIMGRAANASEGNLVEREASGSSVKGRQGSSVADAHMGEISKNSDGAASGISSVSATHGASNDRDEPSFDSSGADDKAERLLQIALVLREALSRIAAVAEIDISAKRGIDQPGSGASAINAETSLPSAKSDRPPSSDSVASLKNPLAIGSAPTDSVAPATISVGTGSATLAGSSLDSMPTGHVTATAALGGAGNASLSRSSRDHVEISRHTDPETLVNVAHSLKNALHSVVDAMTKHTPGVTAMPNPNTNDRLASSLGHISGEHSAVRTSNNIYRSQVEDRLSEHARRSGALDILRGSIQDAYDKVADILHVDPMLGGKAARLITEGDIQEERRGLSTTGPQGPPLSAGGSDLRAALAAFGKLLQVCFASVAEVMQIPLRAPPDQDAAAVNNPSLQNKPGDLLDASHTSRGSGMAPTLGESERHEGPSASVPQVRQGLSEASRIAGGMGTGSALRESEGGAGRSNGMPQAGAVSQSSDVQPSAAGYSSSGPHVDLGLGGIADAASGDAPTKGLNSGVSHQPRSDIVRSGNIISANSTSGEASGNSSYGARNVTRTTADGPIADSAEQLVGRDASSGSRTELAHSDSASMLGASVKSAPRVATAESTANVLLDVATMLQGAIRKIAGVVEGSPERVDLNADDIGSERHRGQAEAVVNKTAPKGSSEHGPRSRTNGGTSALEEVALDLEGALLNIVDVAHNSSLMDGKVSGAGRTSASRADAADGGRAHDNNVAKESLLSLSFMANHSGDDSVTKDSKVKALTEFAGVLQDALHKVSGIFVRENQDDLKEAGGHNKEYISGGHHDPSNEKSTDALHNVSETLVHVTQDLPQKENNGSALVSQSLRATNDSSGTHDQAQDSSGSGQVESARRLSAAAATSVLGAFSDGGGGPSSGSRESPRASAAERYQRQVATSSVAAVKGRQGLRYDRTGIKHLKNCNCEVDENCECPKERRAAHHIPAEPTATTPKGLGEARPGSWLQRVRSVAASHLQRKADQQRGGSSGRSLPPGPGSPRPGVLEATGSQRSLHRGSPTVEGGSLLAADSQSRRSTDTVAMGITAFADALQDTFFRIAKILLLSPKQVEPLEGGSDVDALGSVKLAEAPHASFASWDTTRGAVDKSAGSRNTMVEAPVRGMGGASGNGQASSRSSVETLVQASGALQGSASQARVRVKGGVSRSFLAAYLGW